MRRAARVSFADDYARGLAREALDAAGWDRVEEDEEAVAADELLLWGDFGRLGWDKVLAGIAVGSAYYLKTGVVRKADLHFYLSKYVARHPGVTLMESVPTT